MVSILFCFLSILLDTWYFDIIDSQRWKFYRNNLKTITTLYALCLFWIPASIKPLCHSLSLWIVQETLNCDVRGKQCIYCVFYTLKKKGIFENKRRLVICCGFRLEGLISLSKYQRTCADCWNCIGILYRKGNLEKLKIQLLMTLVYHFTAQNESLASYGIRMNIYDDFLEKSSCEP